VGIAAFRKPRPADAGPDRLVPVLKMKDDETPAGELPGVAAKYNIPAGRLLLSIQELATCLRISRSLAYRLVEEGRLPSIRINKRRLVPVLALLDWIEENTEAPA
jgi:excisionase family DNA binding protein